jgi:hypothetical protein
MRWKPHVRFGGRARETYQSKGWHRALVRSHLANRAIDDARRRTQQELTGHRGRRGDPLYDIRKILLTGAERLTDHARARLDAALAAGDPRDEVVGTWIAN